MTDSAEYIKQSDVTAWGIAALTCGALALLSANLGALLPSHLMTSLHATKMEGGSLNQLRAEVASLREDAVRFRADSRRLESMVVLAEQQSGTLVRRVGSIEATLPALFDTGPRGAGVDASLTTAAIDEQETEIIETEGGSVVVSRQPMSKTMESEIKVQDRPKALQPEPIMTKAEPMQEATGPASAFGLSLGAEVKLEDSVAAWKDITRKAGPLLLGLAPVLSGTAGASEMQLVAGPIKGYAEAEQICGRLVRIGISCLPVPYMGNALP